MTFIVRSSLLLLLLAALGCGSDYAGKVSGKVTLDGAPLTSGDVTFAPTGDGQLASGKIGPDGSYTLRTSTETGIKPGEYVAIVIATGTPPASDIPPPVLTPLKYADKTTSDLKFTVKAGANEINLPLKKS